MAKNWFVQGSTPRRDENAITPLVDGEEAWTRVAAVLKSARKTIHMTWWMMWREMEMLRPIGDTFKEPSVREANTILYTLIDRHNAGVDIRILLWQVSSIAPWLISDMTLRDYGKLGIFEIMYEEHPSKTIGSWHQKTCIVDGKTAFVGGMNTRENDWDTSQHLVYDYRRSPHASTSKERTAWQASKAMTAYKPRHDFMTEIVGPLVTDVEANFVQRWNAAKAAGVDFSAHAATLPTPTLNAAAGNISAQIGRTMPQYPATPGGDRSLQRLYIQAIRNAEQYIYIEDQYFRSQIIAQELAAAVKANKNLILICVAPPDYWYSPSDLDDNDGIAIGSPFTSYWTAKAFETIRAERPEFTLFQLQVSDTDAGGKRVYVPINIHAKLMIVDDTWYTIGSCNLNDRGFLFEGEINVGVLDPDGAKALRKKLFSEHLEVPCPDGIRDAAKLWYDHANANLKAFNASGAPTSRVYAYEQKGPVLPVFPPDWW
jgi:phosphatidylserine/phosphatidylglycerophosphate/cardiolipin synthase-like enzyme